MRVIAVCSSCRRQYRVDGFDPGRKLHCACGGVVTIPTNLRGMEARVVRCSSCGAPREETASRCLSCNSDFTLHELDMDTVCPECLARVSDRAKFCHHCGAGISPEHFSVNSGSKMFCPSCDPVERMAAREVGSDLSIPFFECSKCAGTWLSPETFAALVKNVEREGKAAAAADLFPKIYDLSLKQTTNGAPGRFYRKCPTCLEVMTRRNFSEASGVIVDACKGHGIWFDANELAEILRWIRDGGLADVAERSSESKAPYPGISAMKSFQAGKMPPVPEGVFPPEQSFLQKVLRVLLRDVPGAD